MGLSESSLEECLGENEFKDISLHPEHLKDLKKSGLNQEIIAAAGIRSLSPTEISKEISKILGYCPESVLHAYKIPYSITLNGVKNFFRIKPFPPIKKNNGSVIKYLSPKNGGSHFYVPPGVSKQSLQSMKPLFLLEGEKKAIKAKQEGLEVVIGFSGVYAWEKDSKPISDFDHITWKDREIFLVPDGDLVRNENVKKGVFAFAKELESRAAIVKIFLMPQLDNEKMGLDDYLLNHKIQEFLALPCVNLDDPTFDGLEAWLDRRKEKKLVAKQTEGLPEISADEKHLPTLVKNIWAAIKSGNEKDPSIFRFGNTLARIETNDLGQPVICSLNEDALFLEVSKRANFVNTIKNSRGEYKVTALPPKHGIKGVASTPDKPAPILKRIVAAPFFAPDGALITDPGYCPKAKTYFIPNAELQIPQISSEPSVVDLEEAKKIIFEDLLIDFPFESDSDKAHAVAMWILPALRSMIDGPTPLHGVDAPIQGAGKGLLVKATAGLWLNNDPAVITEGYDEDDWRKRIFSTLRGAPPIILIDNLKGRLESASLEAAITSTFLEDRLLGRSDNASVPVFCLWIATGNNILVSSEIARRFVRIRLNPRIDEPWLRENFRHPNLEQWTRKNRGNLIWAALTLCQSWIAAGKKPYSGKPLGSFECWSSVVGGVLEHAKIPGFLSNLREFYNESDMESQTLKNFINAWYLKYNLREVGTSDLFDMAVEAGISLGQGSDRSAKTRLGIMLSKIRERVFGGYVVKKASVLSGAQHWKLEGERPF